MKHLMNLLILMVGSTTVNAGITSGPIQTIPEPGTYALLAIGAVGMWIAHKRKK